MINQNNISGRMINLNNLKRMLYVKVPRTRCKHFGSRLRSGSFAQDLALVHRIKARLDRFSSRRCESFCNTLCADLADNAQKARSFTNKKILPEAAFNDLFNFSRQSTGALFRATPLQIKRARTGIVGFHTTIQTPSMALGKAQIMSGIF